MPRRQKNGSPLDGYELGRPFGNSPRVLTRSGAGIHGGGARRRNRRDRHQTKRILRKASLGIWGI
jgi:hypothetical protein